MTNRAISALRMGMTGLLVLAAGGCAAGSADEASLRLIEGPSAPIGEGWARAYVMIRAGTPVEVGVRFSEQALAGLPDRDHQGAAHVHGSPSFATQLELPAENPTAYRHVYLTWNPDGHEPPGIYDVGHFDVHFYNIDSAVRTAIVESDPDYQAKAERQPAAEFIPDGYILPAPLAFPRMGVHWVHPASPELNGQPFTHTFIYGSWDGALIFGEPMVTREFLRSRQRASAAVPQPARFATPGWYATRYVVDWDAATREHRVALTDLVRRD